MNMEHYNYNNEELLILNKDDVIKNKELIASIYRDFEKLEAEVSIKDGEPVLVVNGYSIAKVNSDVIEPQKVSTIEIDRLNIYAYVNRKGMQK
ncbi:hypothetical protein ACUXQE_001766 [Staphylococcus saprophyticus]|uniref:hypothetical protein n=2 Tax=Staphylococcus saprophyticus TaxID=29385 RepID=UPI0007B56300|nr:hypothetical protein [Staphylococcus saprophyticus]MBN6092301.1 hypothetical protein [Staphylococcus saprophyticus]MBO0381817.1 hypothetical protein [Staphylococcus saprophyticus]MBU8680986.1 hypothetical protein [Staphylococcus saprophyticus]MCT1652166.1 hypothetical protein [Staphylococcus saprophyticus]MDL1994479.1 hypothetical protein [Staphylococcus saprophyticus]